MLKYQTLFISLLMLKLELFRRAPKLETNSKNMEKHAFERDLLALFAKYS